jgi:hypothetical protein
LLQGSSKNNQFSLSGNENVMAIDLGIIDDPDLTVEDEEGLLYLADMYGDPEFFGHR